MTTVYRAARSVARRLLHSESARCSGDVRRRYPDDHAEAALPRRAIRRTDVDAGVGELAERFGGRTRPVLSLDEERLLPPGERQPGGLRRTRQRVGVLRDEIDLRLPVAGGKGGEVEEVDPRFLERGEHPNALARLVWYLDVEVVHTTDLVCHVERLPARCEPPAC